MKTVVVATDFSERSDRAIRRAKLLAREFDSKLHLVHVVDDDRAQAGVLAERDASTTLLEELTDTIKENDGVECSFRSRRRRTACVQNSVPMSIKSSRAGLRHRKPKTPTVCRWL